jgi:hypothetical protein
MSVFIDVDRSRNRGGKPTSNTRETVEVRTAQAARDMANNKALPLSNSQREDLKRTADQMEQQGLEY